jgi:CheY-like chemotaxis protein
MNVLVVDDVEAVGMIVSRISTQGGWQAYYKDNADNLLETIREKKIDVVLCDYFMPGIQGLDVLRLIREQYKKLPVVFFTGNVDGIDMEAAKALGIYKVLTKPLSIAELRSTLREAYQSQLNPSAPQN